MYFYYGISNSLLENPTEEIELTVDQSYLKSPQKVSLNILFQGMLTKKILFIKIGKQQ